MHRDAQGLDTSGTSDAVAAYDRALGHLVRFQAEVVGVIADARAAGAACAMVELLSAYLSLMSTEQSGVAAAHDALGNLGELAHDLTPREREHLAAANLWLLGDMAGAARLLEDLTLQHPRDLLALAVGHQIDFFTGHATALRDRIGRALYAWGPDDANRGFVQGMYAFGLEECNLYALSEEMAEQAVEANPEDVWGIHAMVHTYEMRGRTAEGLRFLRARGPQWRTGNFLNVHNSWHNALFLLEGDDVDGALAIYDAVLHHDGSEDFALELVDASSLLWRLHLEGAPVGDRWQPLAEAWGRILVPGFYPFNDMHATMAFVGAGRLDLAHELVRSLERVVGEVGDDTTGRCMTRVVGLPVCRSLTAFGRGDDTVFLEHYLPVRESLHRFGGSHAQRDAMERTAVTAAIRAGQSDLARALLSERLGVRERSSYTWRRLAQVLAADGDEAGSSAATSRARAIANEVATALTSSARH
jgi:hypothetical protein